MNHSSIPRANNTTAVSRVMKRHLGNALRGLTLSCLTMGPAFADNDNDPATESVPRVVPYDGVLDLDGASYNGTIDIVFTLYNAADGGEAVWTETWSTDAERAVSVTGGRFSVNLGTFESIESVITDAGQVYLGLQIKAPDVEEYTDLGGRQRINPVPYAMWSANAANLTIAGDAAVGGAFTAEGNVTAGNNLAVGNNVTVDGTLTVEGRGYFETQLTVSGYLNSGPIRLVDDDGGNSIAMGPEGNWLKIGKGNGWSNGVNIVPALRLSQTLVVDGRSSFDGNMDIDGQLDVLNNVTLRDSLTVGDDLSVSDNVTVGDNLTVGEQTLVNDLAVAGDLTVTNKLIKMVKFMMGNDTSINTGISTANWECTVGGAYFDDGDIQENGDGVVLRLYTEAIDNEWWIKADFRSHNDHEGHTVGVVCYRAALVDNQSWF